MLDIQLRAIVNYTNIILSQLDVLMDGTPAGIATKLIKTRKCITPNELNKITDDVATATIIFRSMIYRAMMLNYTRVR